MSSLVEVPTSASYRHSFREIIPNFELTNAMIMMMMIVYGAI